jgi:hypothetical protein
VGWQREERELPVDEDGVIPSPFDPDYECVPVAAAGEPAPSPPPGGQDEPPGPRLCPEGYVPRRRRREYDLDGKVIRSHRPAEHNPDADKRTPPNGEGV